MSSPECGPTQAATRGSVNVWAPELADNEPLPVIVYVYGGGFEMGANTQTTSNASGLAATGRAVGVSLNYRLGPFGWLSLSHYGGALADATNLGLQDITTGLRWVRENIARFGGDPDNVTVAGHSAGAYSATALLAAPAADGLYHHIAAFSGGASRIVPAWWAEELALEFLTELGIHDDPEQLLALDAQRLADTFVTVSPREFGQRQSIDNTTTSIVDDHSQPGGVLTGHPMRALEAGRRTDIDILFSSATHEVDWYVMNDPGFDPGSVDDIVDVFASKGRIPRSRARAIVAAYDTDGRTPAQVRGALYTDYSFTLPANRAALAHAAAGGTAYRLSIGSVDGAHAVHGTELYGIVGQQRPDQSDEQATRDTLVRDTLLTLAEGDSSSLWGPVTTRPTTRGIGDQPTDPTSHALDVLATFEGIERTWSWPPTISSAFSTTQAARAALRAPSRADFRPKAAR